MINFYPSLYRICASSCGILTTIPLDMLETKIVTNKPINFKSDQFKIIFLTIALFSLQNTIYNWTCFLKNKTIQGILVGLTTTPLYIFLESKKLYLRIGLKPKYKKFVFWIILRQLALFITLYNVFELNIKYIKFFSPILSNTIALPIRILAVKSGYPALNLDFKNIKKMGLIEIIKSSIRDGTTLYLIYNFKYSPLKH